MFFKRKQPEPIQMPAHKGAWVVVYDPSVSEAMPYYIEYRIDDKPSLSGPHDFYATEDEAKKAAEEIVERSKQRDELAKLRRDVARYET
jgi:hypothetical protein